MRVPALSVSRRTRLSPFSRRVEDAGAKAYTVYNHMLLPTVFDTVETDYRHLKTHVQLWDVSCERQVELWGPDAGRLAQMLTPRDLSNMTPGRCCYAPMVDETGGMLNDPVILKLAEDKYWVSIADSDLLFWIKGLSHALRLEVDVDEPDVSPLAIQGPKAEDLVARVFGDRIRSIRFFGYDYVEFEGHKLILARSGYSKQGGFELYVDGSGLGEPIWDTFMKEGEDLDVRAGCPSMIERIEARLLSYGNDMTRNNTPHECGLGKFCQTQAAIGCIGRDALLRVAVEGPVRQIRSIAIDGDPVPACYELWPVVAGGRKVGNVSSAAYSPDYRTNVAIGMVKMTHWDDGTRVEVETPDGLRKATVWETLFTEQGD